MNPQASALNEVLEAQNPAVYSLLSKKGKAIFFPKKGLVMQGKDASGKRINASIGMATEDDGSPLRLAAIESLVNMPPEKVFPYAPSYGLLPLRQKWQSIIRIKNPSLGEKEITMPVVTNALTHGLSMAGYLFLDEGDKVILPDYYWGNYNLVFKNAYLADFDTYPMYKDGGFNLDGLRSKLMSEGKKKVVLLNFPNNPTGYTPTSSEMTSIRDIILEAAEAGKNIAVFIDDAYFGLVFEEGVATESIFPSVADLHENVLAVKVDGATKEDYVWGFRVGFMTFSWKGMTTEAGQTLVDKAAGAVRGNISNDSILSQNLLLTAYETPGYADDKKGKYALMKSRYELVKMTIASHPEYSEYFDAIPYNSGYFMCVELKKGNAEDVRQKLLADYDTGIIALGTLIRVAYSSLPEKYIEELFNNIYSACKDLD
ncbi:MULTISPECIES: aminotransferase class I/II-fold pyridoxal phosphate-dependent enzyme [unclassified Oceanispirochaeta]|uniref:aminotransferase class I/II-fold pyridoxal phosphate-dependent enzyme n=1 Tax=unclassified Oceanispirochaeta TaxID=2635722 RepID=UPI000E09CD9F|nr:MULTISPECIES: aminotransferase class I/II-fold pyridoxal phosphate-dependent enzyme [unclassified Oceanispirochaeta]MBF9017392.1 aminotransferase class I/II-fold pyridoxal phosphate-dependent enzyme [Oceanispirochaeta sp. M2]NPD73766.1 aminotransferase class I/II-fold pyridoxal phosphate-dependent enzyme [Oceanispirochaeta sp. M1]RDG30517.1 aminotransferase class I/II-fold pyridoxal phosphate-dependent enzyme [Oceanispirochaeta sp. M1]